MGGRMEGCTDVRISGNKYGWIDEWMDGWMDRQAGGWAGKWV